MLHGGEKFAYGEDVKVKYDGNVYTLKEVFEIQLPKQIIERRSRKDVEKYYEDKIKHLKSLHHLDLHQHNAQVPQWFWLFVNESGKAYCDIMERVQDVGGEIVKQKT